MSTLSRTLRNLRKVGIRDALHQMQVCDTKAGTLIATDRYGNKYFENVEDELPLRTRWVDYKDKDLDASHIEPGWHAWLAYMVDKPPTQDPILQTGVRAWEQKFAPNPTMSRGAFKTYSTTKTKISSWQPTVAPRS
ncbi:putative NADH-ubiquinone oxidoreductase subunit B17.2 [Xylogone sp. PMI_703]|nr:putative NADH-ubiquinone oxidoreductase subunit B17.2 [Xylogone sp. PMI_703]